MKEINKILDEVFASVFKEKWEDREYKWL